MQSPSFKAAKDKFLLFYWRSGRITRPSSIFYVKTFSIPEARSTRKLLRSFMKSVLIGVPVTVSSENL